MSRSHREPSPLRRRRDRERDHEPPPGTWHPSPAQYRDRSRSRPRQSDRRSYRRHNHAHSDNPRQLIAEMGTEQFSRYTLECIKLLPPRDFESIWHDIPQELQKAAYTVPPNIRTDIDNIRDETERKTMCRKINELRRERCALLSSPSQRERWQDESWTFTPMSRETCRRFWEIFRLIPLASPNPVKWKATIEYLKACPEKPDKASTPARCIDYSTRETRDHGTHQTPSDPASPEPTHRTTAAASPKGLDGLSRMARTPQTKNRGREPPAHEDFAEAVRRRVEADVADMDLSTVQITKANRFPSKLKPSKALAQLPSMEAMSNVYRATYEIYYKRFTKLLANINTKTKAGKNLSNLCQSLNIDNSKKDNEALPSLLARLRASDMMKGPP